MKLTIGCIVHVKGAIVTSNGTDVAPAIVTRVWAPHDTLDAPVMVNCTAFLDLSGPQHLGSVMVYDTEEEALSHYDGRSAVAYWPPRAAA